MTLLTVRAPLTTAATIQKLLFKTLSAASFQERLQFKKSFSLGILALEKPLLKLKNSKSDH